MTDLLNLVILFITSLSYLFFFSKVQKGFFLKYGKTYRPMAVSILMTSSLLSAGINLVSMADMASNANRFFISRGDFLMSILFSVATLLSTWIISHILFRISFIFVGRLTEENEQDELMKNNIDLALMHGVVLIIISIVTAPLLVKIASEFIPYPELPFR